MKAIYFFSLLIILLLACSKKTGGTPGDNNNNHAPLASLKTTITKADPFTVDFIVVASDEDRDTLTYTWDFGDGTKKMVPIKKHISMQQIILIP